MILLLFVIFLCINEGIRVPVIIDTAIGSDFDDTMAISYALSRNDVFDIKLILTTTFNTTGRAQLVAKFLDTTNKTNIDIGIGIPSPVENENGGVGPQMPWAADYDINSYPGTVYVDGVNQAHRILSNASPSNPVYYIELAPMSNIGELLSINPLLKHNMRLIMMAGSIYKGYGTDYPQQEYNVKSNGSAARIVYNYTNIIQYANDICAVPLDTSYYFQIYGNNYQKILNSKEIIPQTLIQNYQVWYENGGKDFGAYRPFSPSTATSTMYNAQSMWMASIIAENSTNIKQFECNMIPFMNMQGSRIIVNDSDFTVNDTYNNDNIQTVYEAVTWIGGDQNGSYPLGSYIADILDNPK